MNEQYPWSGDFSFTTPKGGGIMDSTGRILYTINNGYVYGGRGIDNDTFYYTYQGKYFNQVGVISRHFKEVLPGSYDAVFHVADGWIVSRDNYFSGIYWGSLKLKSLDGKRTILTRLAAPLNFKDIYFISRNKKIAIADRKGHRLCGYDYDEIIPGPYNLLIIRQKQNYGLMDMHGKIILPCIYYSIGEWKQGYSKIVYQKPLGYKTDRNGNKYLAWTYITGIVDSTGHIAVPPDSTDMAHNGTIALEKFWTATRVMPDKGSVSQACFPVSIKPLDSAGIKTNIFYTNGGYFSLLKEYPDPRLKNIINNYITLSVFNSLPPDSIETYKEYLKSKDYYFYHNNNPSKLPRGYGGNCYQTEYGLQFLSTDLLCIREKHIYKIAITKNCDTCSASAAKIDMIYKYFSKGNENGDSLSLSTILMPGAWKDTLRQHLKTALDKITPESQVCLSPQQKIQEENSLTSYISIILNYSYFEITRDGLVWIVGKTTLGPHGDIAHKTKLILTYKDMEPYFYPGSPIAKYYKNLK